MDTVAKSLKQPTASRVFGLSLVALLVAVPAAIYVQTYDSLDAWLAENARTPIAVQPGAAIAYGGATWTFTRFSRLDGGTAERAVVLTEFDAVPGDPASLASALCQVILTDELGRRWKPVFLHDPAVKRLHPEAAETPACSGPAFAEVPENGTARFAASFVVPSNAERLALSLGLSTAASTNLIVREP